VHTSRIYPSDTYLHDWYINGAKKYAMSLLFIQKDKPEKNKYQSEKFKMNIS